MYELHGRREIRGGIGREVIPSVATLFNTADATNDAQPCVALRCAALRAVRTHGHVND